MNKTINYLELTQLKTRKKKSKKQNSNILEDNLPNKLTLHNYEEVIGKSNKMHKKVVEMLGKDNLSFLFQIIDEGEESLKKLDPTIGDQVMPILTRKLERTVQLMDHFFSKNFCEEFSEKEKGESLYYKTMPYSSRSGVQEQICSPLISQGDKEITLRARSYIQDILIESMKTAGRQVNEFLGSCFGTYKKLVEQTKNKILDNKYQDEDRQVINKVTDYLKNLYKRYRIDVTDKGYRVFMGGLNDEEESKSLFMKNERFKTFLKIKQRNELVQGLKSLENLQDDLKHRFLKMNNRLDEYENKNETLIKVNKQINSDILKRIEKVKEETSGIKAER